MQIEFEATFLGVDKDECRTRLKDAGATLVHPEYMQKRDVFHTPIPIEGGWLRVRQEADKITMSIKVVNGDRIEDQKEVELTIDSFEKGSAFLQAIGAPKKAYQETLREKWVLDGVDITIDTWPGLRPYVEVEGMAEADVKLVSEKIGFDYQDAKFCEVSSIYKEELGIPPEVMKNETPIITFDNPPKKWSNT
ncbi:MAG: CYTH domain-containing protein [Candidatus Magasanikbacteria bacterium]|jgi:adenylate cyclase, class 2|nr:CYTH domain-containing protein [Candidatus Magasanikbacteria bacterium]